MLEETELGAADRESGAETEQSAVERFLRHLLASHSTPNTVAAYRNDLTQFSQFLEATARASGLLAEDGDGDGNGDGAAGWSAVTTTRIAAFVVYLRDKSYAATTVARKVAAVKSFFHFLLAEGIVAEDPTERLTSPRVEKSLPRGLTGEEIAELLRQAGRGRSPEALRDHAMLHLLWSTGMRVSELVSLDLGDLDLSSGYVRCIGKGGRERIVPISLAAQRALQSYLDLGRSSLVRRGEERALFANHRGDRLTRQGFWLILKGYARDAGLPPNTTPQTLRHSFAIYQLDQQTDLRSLQELLGHANIATTQIYTQVAQSRSRDVERPSEEERCPELEDRGLAAGTRSL